MTIAIPTVNRASLVARAIDSVLSQTSPDIEIIVSDNGSTDETPAVIERYAGRGLRTFRHPVTIPATKHGRFLLEQARGEFFLNLSDDDFLEPEFAERVLATFDRHPEVCFVYTGCAVHYEDVVVPAIVGPPLESGVSFLANHYADQREISWCACVTRVRDLREIGTIPESRVLADMYCWTKLAFKGPVGCVPQVLSHYILLRSQNDNISHGTSPPAWARESQLLVDEVTERLRLGGADANQISRMALDSRSHIARSTANQFVWTRIRGASWLKAWKWILPSIPYLSWHVVVLSRLAAALLLPRRVLRHLLLAGASRQAQTRSVEK